MSISLESLRKDIQSARSRIAAAVSTEVEQIQGAYGVRVRSVSVDMTGILLIGQRPNGSVTDVLIEVEL